MTESTLYQQQLAFANYLRNPEKHDFPDETIEPRRRKIYSDLIYNNIEGFISGGFPVLRSLYSDENWHKRVRHFVEYHPCETPYFLKIGEEFLAYLQSEFVAHDYDPPFILELAHYEYMEVVVDCAEVDPADIEFPEDILSAKLALSNAICLLSYQWPVHMIGPSHQPTEPLEQPVHLLVYRDRLLNVRFMELNLASVALLQSLEQGMTGVQFVEQNEALFKGNSDPVVNILEHWRELGVILGVQASE